MTPLQAPFTSEEMRAAHADLSAIDLEFRARASADPVLRRRSSFAQLDVKHPMLKFRPQSWPTFISRERAAELENATVEVNRIIRSIPETVWGNDSERMGRFYGMAPEAVDLVLMPPNGLGGLFSRGDWVLGPRGFHCVEFNMTSSLGGWETSILAGLLLRVPAVSSYIERAGLRVGFRNTLRILLKHAIEEALRDLPLDGKEMNVTFAHRIPVAGAAQLTRTGYLADEYRAVLDSIDPALDGAMLLSSYDQITQRQGALYLDERRLHVLIERHIDYTESAVFRAFKMRKLQLYNGPLALILTDKRNLALLSERVGSGVFSARDAQILRDHLPWTRQVVRGEVVFEDRQAFLPDLLREKREQMVIKKAQSQNGADVVIGWVTPPEAWDAAVAHALASGDWIVQEYMPSWPYLFQAGDEGGSPHNVVWGFFVFGSKPGGAILRAQPQEKGGVINTSHGATASVLFEAEAV
jgi:hypothetical protein